MHTERGRETLAELGIDARVIPHPVYPSAAHAARRRRTLLSLGVIRPYKGLPDAIEATRRLPDARLLVAGDPAMPLDELRGAERVEWRLGYLPQAELDRALSEATVAVFPYRAELDQSGALLQALGAGRARRSSTTSPASASRCARSAPGASCRPATSTRSPRPCATLLGDADALARARAGAERARARADVGRGGRAAPRALPGARVMFRRTRFGEVIERAARPVRAASTPTCSTTSHERLDA